MFKETATLWNSLYTTLMRVPFIFYLIAIAVYFWVNGPAHFPDWETTYGPLILPYIVMMLAFFVWSKTRQSIDTPSSLALPAFVMGFIATWIIFELLNLAGLFEITKASYSALLPLIIIQVCVVATAEEVIFRGVMLSYLKVLGILGIIIQALLFAVWHFYAYGADLNVGLATIPFGPLIFAFIMGVILGVVTLKKELGLPAAIGIHAAYNLCILGVLTFI